MSPHPITLPHSNPRGGEEPIKGPHNPHPITPPHSNPRGGEEPIKGPHNPHPITPPTLTPEEEKNLLKALTTPTLYGDERDVVIAKYNQIQAGYGTGRAYYTQQGAFVDLKPDNIYCKFKVSILVGEWYTV